VLSAVRVLLVEDSVAQARFIEQTLRDPSSPRPLEVEWVETLAETLRHLAEAPVDLVLLDLVLPDSDGADTFGAVHRAYPEVPVIVLSGAGDESTAIRALAEGAQDYLAKNTMSPVLLSRSIEYALERHRNIVALARDAQRMRAEVALRHSEERTQTILAAANDAFVGMDETGVITDWNRSSERMFGWSSQEAIGRPLSETIIPAASRRAHREGLERDLASEERPRVGRRVEVTALHRDGHEFPAEVSLWMAGDEERRYFNAFIQDISERKQNEHALAVARDHAMEASRMKSQFLATMSHEIRTPMNGVIGLADLLLDTDLGPHQRPYAEGLRAAGEALLTVINDILDFSKIEAGKLELEDIEFDPHQLVDEVVQLMATTAHAKGLEIVGACTQDLPATLRGDPGRLRQIVANLVSNAVKFTDSGEVVVRARPAEESESARTRRSGDEARPANQLHGDQMTVCFEVSDTGIGIDPADRAHILEPFSQADSSTTRRYGGTGLGLAISAQLAEAMGATMTVEGRPGAGSTFLLVVPLGGRADAGPWPTDPSLEGVRVLVVDDNATSRSVLQTQLAAWGMQAEVAADGPSALGRLEATGTEAGGFDLAVVDAAMPGMDGIQLAGRIAANPLLKGTRLLLLTTRLLLDGETATRLGVGESVPKPVSFPELRRSLVRSLASTPRIPLTGSEASVAGDHGRVLVVEDNPVNQLVTTGMLTKLGYRSDVVANGMQAVEALARGPFEAVLMDCNMPVMDGYEATQAIRIQEGSAHHIPIIAMTASAFLGDRERCLAVGMDDYISKPVRLVDLERVLSGCGDHGVPTVP